LERTYVLTLLGVIVVVLMWIAAILPLPRPEPLLELPSAISAGRVPDIECQATISIRSDGVLFYGTQEVASSRLANVLREHQAHHRCEDAPLLLRADRHASYASVRNVVRAARDAHVTTITVVVAASAS
jgi:biopolymer transport protein ExbD